jgi:hypothetical protein
VTRRNRHSLSGNAARADQPSGPTGPAGVDIRCPKCRWDPPPGAMTVNGRRQPDGTWSLVCPADGTVLVEGVVYAGDGSLKAT